MSSMTGENRHNEQQHLRDVIENLLKATGIIGTLVLLKFIGDSGQVELVSLSGKTPVVCVAKENLQIIPSGDNGEVSVMSSIKLPDGTIIDMARAKDYGVQVVRIPESRLVDQFTGEALQENCIVFDGRSEDIDKFMDSIMNSHNQ